MEKLLRLLYCCLMTGIILLLFILAFQGAMEARKANPKSILELTPENITSIHNDIWVRNARNDNFSQGYNDWDQLNKLSLAQFKAMDWRIVRKIITTSSEPTVNMFTLDADKLHYIVVILFPEKLTLGMSVELIDVREKFSGQQWTDIKLVISPLLEEEMKKQKEMVRGAEKSLQTLDRLQTSLETL